MGRRGGEFGGLGGEEEDEDDKEEVDPGWEWLEDRVDKAGCGGVPPEVRARPLRVTG